MSGIIGNEPSRSTGVVGAFASKGIDDNADALAITIDSSENVGIGTTSPDYHLEVEGAGDQYIAIHSNDNNKAGLHFKRTSGYDSTIELESGHLKFMGGAGGTTEFMRIEDDGKVGIGTTDPGVIFMIDDDTADWMCHLRNVNASSSGIVMTAGAGTNYQLYMSDYNSVNKHYFTAAGVWYHSGSQASDERLKENIVDCEHGLAEVLQLTPRKFNFIENPDNLKHGWIAQELVLIMPDMVSGDASLPLGGVNSGIMAVDYDGMSAVLCKAVQELSAKNDALETANTALEARVTALEA